MKGAGILYFGCVAGCGPFIYTMHIFPPRLLEMSIAQMPPSTCFTKSQKAFLEKTLPQFCAYTAGLKGTGPRGVKGVNGEQKKWIKANVLNKFVDNFREHEENKDVLLTVRLLNLVDL
ncbi:hypothetical protein AX14_006628 [Amanita brunnescens Koide BX004]|nr:hypothetical protein AX14_006628 [Amanita brunnescens Koide BX004]